MLKQAVLIEELGVISGAVEAARILADAIATQQLGPDRDHRAAPRAVAAVLSLAHARLRDLSRAACSESHAIARHGAGNRRLGR